MEKKVFTLLFIAVLATTIGVSIIEPLMAIYATSLGATGLYIGFIFAAFTIARGIATPIVGKLSDHHGRKNFIIAGLLAYTISSFLYIYAKDIELLIAVRMLQGMASAFVAPIAMAYIGDISPKGQEGKYLGTFTMSMFLGLGIGPVIGGTLSHFYSMNAAFMAMSLLGFLSLLLVAAMLPELGMHRNTRPTGFVKLLKDKAMQEILLIRFVGSFGVAAFIVFLPLFATTLGLNTAQIGTIVTLNLLTTTLPQRFFGKMADKGNKVAMIAAGNLISGITILAIPFTRDFASLLALNLVMGLGGAISIPANTALAVQIGRMHGMGSSMGLLQTAFAFGLAIGPLLAGLIMDVSGLPMVFIYTSAIVVGGSILFYALVQHNLKAAANS